MRSNTNNRQGTIHEYQLISALMKIQVSRCDETNDWK